MMRTREYNASDLDFINLWLAQRERAPITADELPKRGWVVVDDDDRPTGAVFLRMVEGGYALMDSMINDPARTSKERHTVNERLFLQILKAARHFKLSAVMGTTLDKGTLERAKGHGFVASNQTFAVWQDAKAK